MIKAFQTIKTNWISKAQKILFLMVLLFSGVVYSQDMEIRGSVVDTNFMLPVYGAKAYLVHIEDSVIVGHQNTTKRGEFSFTVPISNYRLFLSHPNYSYKEFLFVGTEHNYVFDIGEIQLDDQVQSFDEIAIYAYRDPIYYVGDTLVYVADSFAVKENAVVEDLLKKLPGIVVEADGSITSQGREISKVYVDGDEFFGSDPTIATKNLAAKSIDKIQVYEVEDEDGRVGDEKLQILDLRLKEDAKKGWIVKANGASDFQKFYEGQVLVNRFTNKQKIFAFGLGSNTLNATVSRSDAGLMGVSAGSLGSSPKNGHPETYRAGFFFSHKEGDKFKFEGNYLFTDSRLTSLNEKTTQYLLSDTTYFALDSILRKTKQQSHDLKLLFDIKIDSSQTLKISPRVSYSLSSSENSKFTGYNDANMEAIRKATNINESNSASYSIGTRIDYAKNFRKKNRQLKLSDNFSYNSSNSTSNLNYFDYFYLTDLTDNEILQLKENESVNWSNTFSASYEEPLNAKWTLAFDYELYNNGNNQDRYSYDSDGTDFTVLDSLTSDVYKTTRMQNKIGISAVYNTSKHNLTFGVRERNLIVENDNLFKNNQIRQNEFSTLPFLSYNYKISQNSRFTTRVTTNSSLPSINYLSPAKDNSNPNAVLEGNENLRSNYNVNINANYMIFKRLSGTSFNIGASARYTFNDFARSITYDNLGRSVSTYENINTFNNVSLRTSFSAYLIKEIMRIRPGFNYTNSNQNNIIDGVNNLTNSHNLTPSLGLYVGNDWIDLNTDLSFTKQIGRNSVNPNLNISNNVWNLYNELTIDLPLKFRIEVDGNLYHYENLSQEFNSTFYVLNAKVAKNFGKYDEWELAVEGYDLLNKNTEIERTFTANTIVDSRNDIISRYFLFRVSYTFNSTFRVKN